MKARLEFKESRKVPNSKNTIKYLWSTYEEYCRALMKTSPTLDEIIYRKDRTTRVLPLWRRIMGFLFGKWWDKRQKEWWEKGKKEYDEEEKKRREKEWPNA